jgi:Tol biopolymer transport system component
MAHLEPGTAIGPYRIDALVGSGGMGDVYRATDTRLHRAVAIKIIAAGLSTDPEIQTRFEREGRLLAALNHPHIGAIHGLEQFDGVHALILEFVEGPTLAERLDSGRLRLDDALRIARQIALALAAAHAKGIVHRDLKPGNIKITPAGDVKVLDFGIAKLGHGDETLTAGASDTVTARETRDGAILGTAAYMSPEQARGQAVDTRTDIWAFGCVLYELLTGRRAFAGGTASDTLARILEREPAWDALPSDVPETIQAVVRRCLKKDVGERWHDIADVELAIRDATSGSVRHDLPATHPRSRAGWMMPALAAAGLLGLAFGAYSLLNSERADRAAPATAVEFGIRFPDNHIPANGIAVSPDGRHIAVGVFANLPQIWLHSLESSETRLVPGTENGGAPFWSADSKTLAFSSTGKLRLVVVPTGQPTTLCDAPGLPGGGTWNSRGEIVFAAGGRLSRVSASGESPRTIPVPDGTYAASPQFLADGHHFIYMGSRRGVGSVYVTSVDGTDHRALLDTDAPAVFAPPDQILFVRGTALMAGRLDPDRLTLAGGPVLIASNVTHAVPLGLRATVSASATGVLAYARPRGGSVGHLTWFERTGQAVSSVPSPPDGEYVNPAISPDGQFLAVNRLDPQTGNWDIWKVDLAQGVPSRLTSDPAQDLDPVWSPDGKEIVFASDRGGRSGLYRKAVDGSRPEEPLLALDDLTVLVPTDWTRDGRYIVYYDGRSLGWTNSALPLFGDREPIHLFGPEFFPYGARVSPDGQWIAYGSFESGPSEVYVQRFLAPGPKQQISHGGGVHPRWTNDGRELVYWAVPGGINAVDFTSDGSTFRVGSRRTLVQAPVLSLIDARTHYDVTRDGRRLLARQPAGPQGAGVTVILNWTTRKR